MAQTAEEEVKALKAQLKEAENRLTAERVEKARKEREERIAALTQKTLEFQEGAATEVIGEPSHWFDAAATRSGGLDITEYEWNVCQYSFDLTPEEAKKLRDYLNETYPA